MLTEPKIITLKGKQLVGQCIEMSLTNNKTFKLFSGFMPERKHIQNNIDSNIYELLIYNADHFKIFSPTNIFTKWATVEVLNNNLIPKGMRPFNLETGEYAVFNYKGLPQGFGLLMNHIFTQWLPKSNYQLENRPHFNVLGDQYIKDSPDSEEEVWIPIKLK